MNRSISLASWTWSFVPFALLLSFAILAAETTQNLNLWRSIYTIRVSAVLALVAFALFPFRNRSPELNGLWLLWWTFSFLAYLVHLLISWFWIFEGNWQAIKIHQPNGVLEANLALTVLWFVDVVLAWICSERDASGGIRKTILFIRIFAWLFTLGSFLIASLYFGKQTLVIRLGYAMAITQIAALILWWLRRR